MPGICFKDETMSTQSIKLSLILSLCNNVA